MLAKSDTRGSRHGGLRRSFAGLTGAVSVRVLLWATASGFATDLLIREDDQPSVSRRGPEDNRSRRNVLASLTIEANADFSSGWRFYGHRRRTLIRLGLFDSPDFPHNLLSLFAFTVGITVSSERSCPAAVSLLAIATELLTIQASRALRLNKNELRHRFSC